MKAEPILPADLGVLLPDGVLAVVDRGLIIFFEGVLLVVAVELDTFIELFIEALQSLCVSVFLCHLMAGPRDMGASILRALFSSFSKLKWDIILNH